MTRHSKNNTASSIFTYHERKKVKDFNTLTQRLGASSMRKFEQCWLCLTTAAKPVTTPAGYIYCRECIILCLTKQMENNKKMLSQWEAETKRWRQQVEELRELKEAEKKRKLVAENLYALDKAKKAKIAEETKKNVFKEDVETKSTGSFWISSAPKPTAKETELESLEKQAPPKPKAGLTCPISGKPLRVKDLVDLNPESAAESGAPNAEPVWICSVSKKPILHNQACAYRKNGRILLKQYIATCDEGEKDAELFIDLIPAGTGFAYHNTVEAKKFRPCMQ